MDRWQTKNIVCDGGLNLHTGILEQGTLYPGSARELINYEPAEDKGYRKLLGYTKYNEVAVPGDVDAPVTLAQPFKDTVVAVRYSGTSNDIYTSDGTGAWVKQNSSLRPNNSTRARSTVYSISEEVIVVTDGSNPALKFNGTTDVVLNTAGAPTNPKYGTEHLNRLVLSGYTSNPSAITISSPNDDEDFNAANGAIELNVGDIVVGLASFRNTLYIFCQNSIHKLSGADSTTFAVDNVTDRIGCVSGDTIQEIAGDLIFLAPDGLRSLAATDRIGDVELGLQSRPIQQLTREVIQQNPQSFSSVAVVSKSQYRLFYFVSGKDDNSQQGVLGKYKPNERYQYEWATTLGFPVYSAGYRYLDDNRNLIVFGHPDNGIVYQMESSGGLDGNSLPFSYCSPPLTFDDTELRKVVYKLETTAKSEATTSISNNLILDEYLSEQTIQPPSDTLIIEGAGVAFGDGVFGGFVFSESGKAVSTERMIRGSGDTVTIKYSGSNTDAPHTIESFTITYAMKGRR